MRFPDTSLDYCLRRLDQIGSHLRLPSNRLSYPNFIAELRAIISLLEYHTCPKEGNEYLEGFRGPQVSCQYEGCTKTWRDDDACLLFLDNQWLCRDHHPLLKKGGVRPPGYQPPIAARQSLEAARQAAYVKLSREERRLLNTRIGG